MSIFGWSASFKFDALENQINELESKVEMQQLDQAQSTPIANHEL